MNGTAAKACVGMICVAVIYGSYMMANAIAGQPIPDGAVLSGAVGAVCVLAGVEYGLARAKSKR